MRVFHNYLVATFFGLAIAALGCNESPGVTEPSTGSINITVTTVGANPDPTGYSVVVAGGSVHVESNGTRSIPDLPEGAYDVFLTDLAGNCNVDGPNPLRANVTSGTTVQVAFSVRCVAESGWAVMTVTSGVAVDPDGYLLEVRSLGASSPITQRVLANATTEIAAVLPGNYVLTISDIRSNCDVAPNPRTVEVAAESVTSVVFEVTCPAPTQVAFTSYSNNAEIWVVNSSGGVASRLTTSAGDDREPAWSPDGDKLAFMSDRDGNREIYVMNADGTSQTRLTSHPAADDSPAWSPDGSRIAFVSERDGNPEIYVMSAGGANAVRLTNRNGYDSDPAWSPDGRRIAFAADGRISVMNVDGSGLTFLTSERDAGPQWSPDGTRIVFSREVSSAGEAIFIMDADGSNVTRLTAFFYSAEDPTWSSDGRRIAFAGLLSYDYYTSYWPQIFVISVEGIQYSSPSTLNAFGPAWGPR